MTILNKIEFDRAIARRNRNEKVASLLTTLVAEAQAVGKRHQRLPTDDETVATIRKFIKNNEQTLAVSGISDEKRSDLMLENSVLMNFLPKQLSKDEILACFKLAPVEIWTNKGLMMKHLKTQHGGSYDGKVASDVYTEFFTSI